MAKDINLPKMTYREFVSFMSRYERDMERKEKQKSYKSPYKYTRVFNKGNKNES